MAYELQKQIRLELDTRLPRGPKGSLQNELRQRVSLLRARGLSFEASLEKAVSEIRQREPGFTPQMQGTVEAPQMVTNQDKRAAPRYRVKTGTFAYFRFEGARQSGPVVDLSLGGLYIQDEKHQFSAGTELELGLGLGKDMVLVRGIVVRAAPGRGFAVRFQEISDATRKRLEGYLQRLSELAP